MLRFALVCFVLARGFEASRSNLNAYEQPLQQSCSQWQFRRQQWSPRALKPPALTRSCCKNSRAEPSSRSLKKRALGCRRAPPCNTTRAAPRGTPAREDVAARPALHAPRGHRRRDPDRWRNDFRRAHAVRQDMVPDRAGPGLAGRLWSGREDHASVLVVCLRAGVRDGDVPAGVLLVPRGGGARRGLEPPVRAVAPVDFGLQPALLARVCAPRDDVAAAVRVAVFDFPTVCQRLRLESSPRRRPRPGAEGRRPVVLGQVLLLRLLHEPLRLRRPGLLGAGAALADVSGAPVQHSQRHGHQHRHRTRGANSAKLRARQQQRQSGTLPGRLPARGPALPAAQRAAGQRPAAPVRRRRWRRRPGLRLRPRRHRRRRGRGRRRGRRGRVHA
mmetsp:Transcript_950/g.2842  ORF Transcript_950/g.2842 Transcript_950/m.2842 type:complete len:388 (+) Transcript_950:100-1263(+)